MLLVIIYIFAAINTSHKSVGVTSLPQNEYLEEVDTPEIDEWIVENTSDDNKTYIVQHKNDLQNNAIVHYLICTG